MSLETPGEVSPTDAHQAMLALLHPVIVAVATRRQDELPGLVNLLKDDIVLTMGGAWRPAYHRLAERVWRCDDRRAHELFLNADRQELPPGVSEAESMLVTLLHGACHVWAQLRRIRDTSRHGRYHYHNEQFITIALTIGLAVEKDVTTGDRTLTLSSWARIDYVDLLTELEQGLVLIREPERQT